MNEPSGVVQQAGFYAATQWQRHRQQYVQQVDPEASAIRELWKAIEDLKTELGSLKIQMHALEESARRGFKATDD